ncbi:MAG: tetratricopeptide repeat protein [Fidelibacterota bacterium]|nr:MAG: tetratricopeptide repeat protein [Candidatus Neomarinimicrobiota bacterium]
MSDPPSRLAAFISELKHRRVFRVAAVYACVAFIIIQIIDGAFDYLHIPEWVGTTIIVLLAIGFPIAVGLAWAFDITDKGIVRTKPKREVTATKAPHPLVGNKTLAVIAALAIIVAAWALLREPSLDGAPIASIAVLPLDNQMGDPEQEYFVEGMHDAIITELSRISALKVISRNSAMYFKDKDILSPEIARQLNVDALVEGSVLKAGNRVRITAQLIHGASDEHLWTNNYEGDLTNILPLQKTVAGAIAKEIGLALKPEEEADLASAPQVNPEAYDLYLRGWHLRTRETREGTLKSVDYLEQAVAINPTFARAYALLSHGYLMLDGFGVISRREARIKARNAIERALELDDSLSDTHVYLALYKYMYEWDWTGAERAFQRAIELDPNHVHAHFEYGLFLGRLGRFEEALVEAQRAKELDPLSLQADFGIGTVHLLSRQFDKAIEQYTRVLELDSHQSVTRFFLARAYYYKSMYAKALEEFENLGLRWGIMLANYAMGWKTEALPYFDSLKVAGEQRGITLGSMAIYSLLGDKEEALNRLEKAYQERSRTMHPIKTGPEYDFLRAEPRFKALMQKLGLTEVFDQYGQRIQ